MIHDDATIVCPFYKSDHKSHRNVIRCEGLVDSTVMHIVFKTDQHLMMHKMEYCRSMQNYNECPLARALGDKYYGE